MLRIRTIKPEFFKHDELYQAEADFGLPLRVAYAGLFCVADRSGRFKWKPKQLKLDVLPYDEVDFSRVLDALATRGFLVKYAIDSCLYGVIKTFAAHQHFNNKEKASVLPENTTDSIISVDLTLENKINDEFNYTRELRVNYACDTPLNLDQGEGKGREGKGTGKERNGKGSAEGKPISLKIKNNSVLEVFEKWKKQTGHLQARLDDKRIKLIKKSLALGYTEADLCLAIEGVTLSPWHNGTDPNNKTSTQYFDLEFILRDAKNIDKFKGLALNPPSTASKQIQQANIVIGRIADKYSTREDDDEK